MGPTTWKPRTKFLTRETSSHPTASIATAMKAVLTPEEIWKTVEGMSSLIRAETGRSSMAARRSVLALARRSSGREEF